MGKPDKVLRFRPLKEVPEAVAKLKRVVLIHPKPIVQKLKAKFCVCGKGERKTGKKSKLMIQCEECWEWYHSDCVGVDIDAIVQYDDWRCEWCRSVPDKEGYQRWKSRRKTAKKRHRKDIPKLYGAILGGDPDDRYSAPSSWEGKVEQIKEMARRAAIKKRKLTEAAEKLICDGGHHLMDAEGMDGLELRPVNDGMIDEILQSGLIEDIEDDDS